MQFKKDRVDWPGYPEGMGRFIHFAALTTSTLLLASQASADFSVPYPPEKFEAPPEKGMTHSSGTTAQYVTSGGASANTFIFNVPPSSSSVNHTYAGINFPGGKIMEIGFEKHENDWQPFLRFPGPVGASVGEARIQHPSSGVDETVSLKRSPNMYVPYAGFRKGIKPPKSRWIGPEIFMKPGDPLKISVRYDPATGKVETVFTDGRDPTHRMSLSLPVGKHLPKPEIRITAQQARGQKSQKSSTIEADLDRFFSGVRTENAVRINRRSSGGGRAHRRHSRVALLLPLREASSVSALLPDLGEDCEAQTESGLAAVAPLSDESLIENTSQALCSSFGSPEACELLQDRDSAESSQTPSETR